MQIRVIRYATYAQGSSFTLWVRKTCAVESPRCTRHTPRALRAPSNFEHAKKNRRAIAKHILRGRCTVNAQHRRQRRRAYVEYTQPVREWSQLKRECTQLIREWSPHQNRIVMQMSNWCCVHHISLRIQSRYKNTISYDIYTLSFNNYNNVKCLYTT